LGDEFALIQEKIEAVLTLLKSANDPNARKTHLLEFRPLLDEADRLLVAMPHTDKQLKVQELPSGLR